MNEISERYAFPAQATGYCSTHSVTFANRLSIRSAKDFKTHSDREMLYKWHMFLATHHGIYTYPGSGGIFISAVHTKDDINNLVASTEEFVRREKS